MCGIHPSCINKGGTETVFERTQDFEVKGSRSSVTKTERGIQGFVKMCDNQLVSVTSFPC